MPYATWVLRRRLAALRTWPIRTRAAASALGSGSKEVRRQRFQGYLPASTRRLRQLARDGQRGLGAAAMATLRGSYDHIVANHIPEPVGPVGPFPAPRTVRRREHVDDARMKPIYVDPGEAAAIEALADQCELSISELVTIAIDYWYGAGKPSP
jgi:hypothetical protein